MKIFPKSVINKIEKKQEELPFCKICFETSNTIDNKLIHPCKCDGSIKFVHQKCILKWLNQTNDSKKVCEICKYEYKLKKQHNNEFYFFYKDQHSCRTEGLLFFLYIICCSLLATIYGIADTTNDYSWTKFISNNNTISVSSVKYLYESKGTNYDWNIMYYLPMGVYSINVFYFFFFLFLPLMKVYQYKLYYKLIYKYYLLFVFTLNLYLYMVIAFLQNAPYIDFFQFFLYVNILLCFCNYPLIRLYMNKHDVILKEINKTHNILKIANYENENENVQNENIILETKSNFDEGEIVYNPLNLIPEEKIEIETQDIIIEEDLNNLVLEIKDDY